MTRTNPFSTISFSGFSGTLVLGLALTFGASVLSPSVADAQNKDKAPKTKTFDFSADEIDGELVKPNGDFVDPRKFATHTNLIKIRQDFIKEILKSAEDL